MIKYVLKMSVFCAMMQMEVDGSKRRFALMRL